MPEAAKTDRRYDARVGAGLALAGAGLFALTVWRLGLGNGRRAAHIAHAKLDPGLCSCDHFAKRNRTASRRSDAEFSGLGHGDYIHLLTAIVGLDHELSFERRHVLRSKTE